MPQKETLTDTDIEEFKAVYASLGIIPVAAEDLRISRCQTPPDASVACCDRPEKGKTS